MVAIVPVDSRFRGNDGRGRGNDGKVLLSEAGGLAEISKNS